MKSTNSRLLVIYRLFTSVTTIVNKGLGLLKSWIGSVAEDLSKDCSFPLKSVKGEYENTLKILTDRVSKN